MPVSRALVDAGSPYVSVVTKRKGRNAKAQKSRRRECVHGRRLICVSVSKFLETDFRQFTNQFQDCPIGRVTGRSFKLSSLINAAAALLSDGGMAILAAPGR
jgi:hypothetical protein